MSKVTITHLVSQPYLIEIYQSVCVRMAILRQTGEKSYERITPMVLCRDFLTDVYTFSKADMDFSIYGMTFNGSTEKPDYSRVILLLQFPSQSTKANFLTNLPRLHEIEGREKNKRSLTQTIDISDSECIVIGDGQWLKNCLAYSLYTFLLRALCYQFPEGENWITSFDESTDLTYASSVHPSTWERVFSDLTSIDTPDFCGFPVMFDNLRRIHSNSGFISVFGRHRETSLETVRNNTHWKLMKERGFELNTK